MQKKLQISPNPDKYKILQQVFLYNTANQSVQLFNNYQLNNGHIYYVYLDQVMKLSNIKQNPLCKIFKDSTFAWQLLETQVSIQLYPVAHSSDISKLLALYMKGVQVMNQIYDPRQTYFKNKAISLMGKSSVIKSFNQFQNNNKSYRINKQKDQIQGNIEQTQGLNSKKNRKSTKQAKQSYNAISSPYNLNLLEKKKEIEVRVAYGAQQQSPQVLNRLLKEHTEKQTKFVQKIQNIINDHQTHLNERIKQRIQRQKRDISKMRDPDISTFSTPVCQQDELNKQQQIVCQIKPFNQEKYNQQGLLQRQNKYSPCAVNNVKNNFNSPKVKQFLNGDQKYNQNNNLIIGGCNQQNNSKLQRAKLKSFKSMTNLRTRHKIFDFKPSKIFQLNSGDKQLTHSRRTTIDICQIKQYSM